MQSPAGQQHRQLVDRGFPLDGEAVVLLYGVDVSLTASHDLPEVCERHSELLKHAVVKILEVLVEGDAPQPVGDVQDLTQTRAEEREGPQEGVDGAGVRPGPERGAEEAQSQEGEQVEEAVKPAAPHEAEEEEDMGEVEHGALRAVSPGFTPRVSCRGRLHGEVHGFEVRRLHLYKPGKTKKKNYQHISLKSITRL